MKAIFSFVLALLTVFSVVGADARGIHGGGQVAPNNLNIAATRGEFGNALTTGGNVQGNFQSVQYARATTCTYRILLTNSYMSGTVEAGPGGSTTFTAAINYPAGSGTFYQVTWGGGTSIAAPTNQTAPPSDTISGFCPTSGDKFYTRIYAVTAGTALPYYDKICTNCGELAEVAVSGLADKTMGGTIAGTFTSGMYQPIAVLAVTTNTSYAFLGDSICYGTNDFPDTATEGDIGILARSIGPTFAYTNLCRFGETPANFTNSHGNRFIAASYATGVISEYGTNGIAGGQTLAQLVASLQTISGYFPAKPYWQTTLLDRTTSTDSFTSAVNQSAASAGFAPLGTGSIWGQFNVNLRAGTYASWARSGWLDIVNPLEGSNTSGVNGVNTGIWLWDATPQHWTNDGTHPITAGYLLEQSSGIICGKLGC